MTCPAVMLANNRTQREKGLVNISIASKAGIKGTGIFSQVGTWGLTIPSQYFFVVEIIMVKKVNRAKTIVMAIFPVMFAPPGKKGIKPNKLHKNMNKKTDKR